MDHKYDIIVDARQRGLELIADYVRCVGAGGKGDELFRGHSASGYIPTPTAFRLGAAGIRRAEDLREWKKLAGRFERFADDVHALVLAQHCGIETPLLDWTANPFTALFFACERDEGDSEGGGGQVLRTARRDFLEFDYTWSVDPFNQERVRPALLDATAMNFRAIAQDSFLSLHSECCPVADTASVVFEVPGKEKWVVRHALEMLGVTRIRMFADIDTAAADMKQRLRSRMQARAISDIASGHGA